ncbi:MAG: hypothetical protein P8Z35_12545, partial [Ignavibacteriaceae bacterium]
MYRPGREIKKIKETSKRLSRKGFLKSDFRRFFRPIDYTRTAELPAVLNLSKILTDKREGLKILDISSPQILSASIAEVSQSWDLTYANPFQAELDDMLRISNLLSLKNINLKKIDITFNDDLKRLRNDFDYIFSSSVFEHIHPEEGGDVIAAKNAGSLLKQDGVFVISVPFYFRGFNEYKFGDVYSVKGNKDERIFFQRFYDEEKLNNQLIIPSNLALESILYIGERFYFPNNIRKRFAQKLQS